MYCIHTSIHIYNAYIHPYSIHLNTIHTYNTYMQYTHTIRTNTFMHKYRYRYTHAREHTPMQTHINKQHSERGGGAWGVDPSVGLCGPSPRQSTVEEVAI